MSTNKNPAMGSAHQDMRSVTIRVFCSGDHTPQELREIPVSLTIADLRARLAQAIPSHPAPATQRLFFLGRRLMNDNMTVGEVINGLVGESFTFHLLLPMEASSGATTSIARASRLAPQNPVSPATGVSPNPQRPLPGAGDIQRRQSIEVARRRIAALAAHLGGVPPPAEDILARRRRVPAWQAAHMHQATPTPAPAARSAQAIGAEIPPATTGTSTTPRPRPTSTAGRAGLLTQGPGSAFPFAAMMRREYSVVDPNGQEYLLVAGERRAVARPAATLSAAANIRPVTRADEEPVGVAAGPDNGLRQLVADAAMRRLWLFARLWMMSYLLSPWGAWARVFFVFVSALASVLFEFQRPRWLWESVVRPIRAHLEDLANMGGPGQVATGQNDGENRGDRHGRSEAWEALRRAEGAIVLLLASLIPGVGERQVQARNAAEAERARQQGQERARAEDGSEADGAEPAQAQQATPEEQQERGV